MLGKYLSPATRISIGLAGLTVAVLMVAQLFGIVPDSSGAALDGRKVFCETVACDWALLAQKGDLDAIRASAGSIVQRNGDVESIALRSADGKLLLDTGGHETHWKEAGGGSSVDLAVIPLFGSPGQKPWAQMEIRFRPLAGRGGSLWAGIPILGTMLFLSVVCFVAYRIYIARVLGAAAPGEPAPRRSVPWCPGHCSDAKRAVRESVHVVRDKPE